MEEQIQSENHILCLRVIFKQHCMKLEFILEENIQVINLSEIHMTFYTYRKSFFRQSNDAKSIHREIN